MDEGERIAIERAQKTVREALALLPRKKDDKAVLARELLGAEEEGSAFDVMLVAGADQDAPEEFWQAARAAAKALHADESSGWLSAEAKAIVQERLN